jgi:hypothetical protein
VAVTAKFYGWPPSEINALTWSQVKWWAEQGAGMK